MGLLNEEMKKRLSEWREATSQKEVKPLPKREKPKSYVSRRGYGDAIDENDRASESSR